MLTMAVCALVLVRVALHVYANAPILAMFWMPSSPLAVLLLTAAALVVLLSSFTFGRILHRRSALAAKLYLMGVFASSGLAILYDWQQRDTVNIPGLPWLAFIAGLFFSIRPAGLVHTGLHKAAHPA